MTPETSNPAAARNINVRYPNILIRATVLILTPTLTRTILPTLILTIMTQKLAKKAKHLRILIRKRCSAQNILLEFQLRQANTAPWLATVRLRQYLATRQPCR